MSGTDVDPTQDAPDPAAYVARVMAEVQEEARARRASGDLPPKLERELDELFLAHSPVAGRGGDLAEALRLVDVTAHIDPVVPVASDRAAGAFVKKGMRSALLWYVGWITHQISQFAAAVSRSLHIVEGRLKELERRVEVQRVPGAGVVEFASVHGDDAWWVEPALTAVRGTQGRVLQAACGDGGLVQKLRQAGIDAYGVDPRVGRTELASSGALDLRGEDLAEHLRAVAPAALGGLVLTGIVDGMAGGEREQLLALVGRALGPGGVLVVHSVTPSAWDGTGAPWQADLAPGRPLRAETWPHLLASAGYVDAVSTAGPGGDDYVVTAVRSDGFAPGS